MVLVWDILSRLFAVVSDYDSDRYNMNFVLGSPILTSDRCKDFKASQGDLSERKEA